MKNLLFAVLLLASFSVNSATVGDYISSQRSADTVIGLDSWHQCTSMYCAGGASGPAVLPEALDNIGDPYDTVNYFAVGDDLYYREMNTYVGYLPFISGDYKISWFSHDVTDAFIYINGQIINFSENGNLITYIVGYFDPAYDSSNGWYDIVVSANALSMHSSISWQITPVDLIETPIPAPLLLLAPALLGMIGLRKLKTNPR